MNFLVLTRFCQSVYAYMHEIICNTWKIVQGSHVNSDFCVPSDSFISFLTSHFDIFVWGNTSKVLMPISEHVCNQLWPDPYEVYVYYDAANTAHSYLVSSVI